MLRASQSRVSSSLVSVALAVVFLAVSTTNAAPTAPVAVPPVLAPGTETNVTTAPAQAPAQAPTAAAEAPAGTPTNPFGDTGFITVQGNKFVDANCKEFFFVGGNSWLTLEAASNQLHPDTTAYLGGRDLIQYLFATAQASNITVIRTLAGSADDSDDFVLQTAPGVYNEVAFQGLDKIINDASEAGIKLILPFTDNWHFQDGLFQYVEWGHSMATGDFFTDPTIIQLYKNHVTAIVNRTNTLNGRQYKDEPAIFAWDLINELRDGCNTSAPNATCDPAFTGSVQAWIEEVSAFVKAADPNHLVIVGEEGFYGPGSPDLGSNPSPGLCTPQVLTRLSRCQHMSNLIAGIVSADSQSLYAKRSSLQLACLSCMWTLSLVKDPVGFTTAWLTAHIANAQSLGKPFIVEEFGKSVNARAAFWEYSYIAGPPDTNQVLVNESTWSSIIEPAADGALQTMLSNPAISNCVPGPLKSTTGSTATAGRR
ncbi:MAG: mannan endo-1 [Trebouxia sp. A1-2]|nr:MAG: mannan endo-1 [Trebouxia sp. A1-2]